MEDVTKEFEWYANWAADISPLYERLAHGVAESPRLLDIAREATDGQPAPQLLLGAVHALLLGGTEHPLASFYHTCTETPTDPRKEDPFPAFREVCLAHETTIRETVASRRVQTNEVGRSAVLLPAFEHVARTVDRQPLALVEIGASAGLNLCWDRYRYNYADYGIYGVPDAPVTIESAIKGDRTPPLPRRLPEVVSRVGNDLEPLDITDSNDTQWLRALVVPEQVERHDRLSATIEFVRQDPPELVSGDACAVLDNLIADLPDNTPLCVFSTLTLYQLDEAEITRIRETLLTESQTRPVHWLSGDPFTDRDQLTYRHVEFDDEDVAETQLAEYESYGKWIRWIEG